MELEVQILWENKIMTSGVYIRTEETKKNLSIAGKGQKHSEATRKKISDAKKGIPTGVHNNWKGGISKMEGYHRNRHLMRLYGITLEDYNKVLFAQEGRCLGCGIHHTELKQALSVDHNHITNKVRGLLCSDCNFALGHAFDNPETLRNLADYLEESK